MLVNNFMYREGSFPLGELLMQGQPASNNFHMTTCRVSLAISGET